MSVYNCPCCHRNVSTKMTHCCKGEIISGCHDLISKEAVKKSIQGKFDVQTCNEIVRILDGLCIIEIEKECKNEQRNI